jgi:hypothetical protein
MLLAALGRVHPLVCVCRVYVCVLRLPSVLCVLVLHLTCAIDVSVSTSPHSTRSTAHGAQHTEHSTRSTDSTRSTNSTRCVCVTRSLFRLHRGSPASTPPRGLGSKYSTAHHSTAQHSTAQHSTAQHSTAQHSTAQHSTAQHRHPHPHTTCIQMASTTTHGAHACTTQIVCCCWLCTVLLIFMRCVPCC